MKTNSPLTVVKSPRGETRQSAADFGAKYPLSLALMLSALVVCAGMATPSAQAQDAATPQAAPAAGAAPADTQAPAEVAAPAATGESVALAPTNTATTSLVGWGYQWVIAEFSQRAHRFGIGTAQQVGGFHH